MIIRTAIKAGLAGGAVYYSIEEGIWQQNTEKTYERYRQAIQPVCESVRAKLPFEIPALPTTGEVGFVTKYYYNSAVKGTIRFIHMLPCYAGQAAKKTSDTIKQFAQPPAPATDSK